MPESAGVVLEGRPEKENRLGDSHQRSQESLGGIQAPVGNDRYDPARFSHFHTHTADTLWPLWVSVRSHKLFSTRPGDS